MSIRIKLHRQNKRDRYRNGQKHSYCNCSSQSNDKHVPVLEYAVDTVLNVLTVGVVNDVRVGVVTVEADDVVSVVVTGVLRSTVDSDAVMNVAGVVVLSVICEIPAIGRLRHTFRFPPPFRHDRNPNDKLQPLI